MARKGNTKRRKKRTGVQEMRQEKRALRVYGTELPQSLSCEDQKAQSGEER